MSQATEKTQRPLFTRRNLVVYPLVFAAAFLLAWAVAQGVQRLCEAAGSPVDVQSKWWPLSCFSLKVPGMHAPLLDLCGGLAILLVFFFFVRLCFRRPRSNGQAAGLLGVLATGLFFVICTNLIHGPRYGLANPHLGDGQDSPAARSQYYHDATQVTSAWEFLQAFEKLQPQLSCHGRTHPPGAVLLYYGLRRMAGTPAAVSLMIAALSVGLSGVFLYRSLGHEFDRETCGYVTLLFLLMPAVQIYYCATLDAVVASCFLGVLLGLREEKGDSHLLCEAPEGPFRQKVAVTFFRQRGTLLSTAGMVGWLFCASLLTFAACFLVPVIVGFEAITRRSIRRSAAVVLTVAVLYAAVYFLCGFNYLASLKVAAALENPAGFLLLAQPASYLITRLENVADILLFFGPFLLALCLRGVRIMSGSSAWRELLTLTGLGIFTLLAMFLTGAFRTGETARACLFIYPYLMFPVAACLHHRGCRYEDKRLLLWLVFGQSLAMQTFGGYYW